VTFWLEDWKTDKTPVNASCAKMFTSDSNLLTSSVSHLSSLLRLCEFRSIGSLLRAQAEGNRARLKNILWNIEDQEGGLSPVTRTQVSIVQGRSWFTDGPDEKVIEPGGSRRCQNPRWGSAQ
jgi:hypothetical protein